MLQVPLLSWRKSTRPRGWYWWPSALLLLVLAAVAATADSEVTATRLTLTHCCCLEHVAGAIAELVKEYQAKGLAVVAISSNSSQTHPQDGPDKMAEDAKAHGELRKLCSNFRVLG
jgi:hypothetical protein